MKTSIGAIIRLGDSPIGHLHGLKADAMKGFDPDKLPGDFVFGSATAAYQIEGAVNEDGRGPSIWDAFSHRPGNIADGTNGDMACDHYHRLDADLDLIASLNHQAYRFSIAWPRVMPQGVGAVNTKGLDFYDRLVDGLLERGIMPFPTLFHWDMPQALYAAKGGFKSRDVAYHFADYAGVVAERLGDRVKNWITLNEPWEHAFFGYVEGWHAPGEKKIWRFLPVIHHLLLGHGLATQAIRDRWSDAKVGTTISYTPAHATRSGSKHEEARQLLNEILNFVTTDALFKGKYPEKLWRKFWFGRPKIRPGDMEIISRPVDFLGVNYYSCVKMHYERFAIPFGIKIEDAFKTPPQKEQARDGARFTTMGWRVEPEGLGEVLGWLRERYGNPPIYVTENGMALDDRLVDGHVHDQWRIDYIRDHLGAVQGAMSKGSDVRGYFVWSLFDNFEWALGNQKRFGMVHVNFDDFTRTPKDSALWYGELIAKHRSGRRGQL